MNDRNAFDPAAPGPTQTETDTTLRCPKCGRKVNSVLCAHCGSRLSPEQSDLFGAVVKQLLQLGGDRTDATNKGGIAGETGVGEPMGNQDAALATSGAGTSRREDPDGTEFDESVADNIKQVACPYCGRSFPI